MNDANYSMYDSYFCISNYQPSSIDSSLVDYDAQTTSHYSNNCELLSTTPAVEQRHHGGQTNIFPYLSHTRDEPNKIADTATNLCVSNTSAVPAGPAPTTFVNIPFVQIHTTDVQPQRTSYGNVFRRNISRQEEIKSEPIKSEGSDSSKERTNATPTPPRAPSATQKNQNAEDNAQNQNELVGERVENINEQENQHKEEDQLINQASCQVYKCSLCPFISLSDNQRYEHEKSRHADKQKEALRQELKCPGCTNVFYIQESLETHLRLDHIMPKDEALKLAHSIVQANSKDTQQSTKGLSGDSIQSEPQRKSRIYLKNVECLREPNRQPIEQTENQLFGNCSNNNSSNASLHQNQKAPKQKISIKSVDVLREPALLRRDYGMDNTNYSIFSADNTDNQQHGETVSNATDPASFNDNQNDMISMSRNQSNGDCDKTRKPKIYVKSVESFNLMPLEYIESQSNIFNNATQPFDSNSAHIPFIYETNTNIPISTSNVSGSYGHNDMTNNAYQIDINSSSNDNNYILDNNPLYLVNVDNMGINNCGGQVESVTLITDPTPPPDSSAVNLEEPINTANNNFPPAPPEPQRGTLHLRTVDELNLMNENEFQHPTNADISQMSKNSTNSEQRGTLHLRTVDELNLMNENEVQHLIAPNLDNNHSTEGLDNNINMNDDNLIGHGIYDDSDAFKFQDLDSQMANEWPETYDDLAEDINGIITEATNNPVTNNNNNREGHVVLNSTGDNQKTFSSSMEVDNPQMSLITIRDIEELTGGTSYIHDMVHDTNYANDNTSDVTSSIANISEQIDNSVVAKGNCGTSEDAENLKRELSNATPETKDSTTLGNECESNIPIIRVELHKEVPVTTEPRSPILTALSVCEINARSPKISSTLNKNSDCNIISSNELNSITQNSIVDRVPHSPIHIPNESSDNNFIKTSTSSVTSKNVNTITPLLATVTHMSTSQSSATTSSNDIPIPPLVPVTDSIMINREISSESDSAVPKDKFPPAQETPAEKGRIYVANNLMEPPKKPVSVRGRPFGSNRTRMALESTSTNDVFVKCSFKGCAFRFKKNETLEYHIKCHDIDPANVNSNQVAICPECKSMEFSNWNTLHTHLWRAHQIDMELYKCDLCDFKTPIFSRLANTHAKIHSDDRNYKCEQCGKAFKNSKQLKNHRRWHRVQLNSNNTSAPPKELPQPNIHRCPDCGSTFSHQKTLKEHCCKNNASSIMKCDICQKVMSTKASLKLHLLTHKEEKRFKCQQCNYATNDHNAFRRHRMGHENKKMYDCQFCDYKSVQSVTYQKHVRHKHPDKADTVLHKCSHCPYTTINRSLLIVHQAKHHKDTNNEMLQTTDGQKNNSSVNTAVDKLVASNIVTERINSMENTTPVISPDVQKSKIKVKSNLFTV